MINNNYAGYNPQQNNVSYGAVKDVVPENINQKLPENIQNIDANQITESNGAVASAAEMDPKSLLASLPFYTSFLLLRNLNDKVGSPFSFSGEYEKTFLGKLTKLGDGISKAVSKAIPDKVENGFKKGIKNAKNWIQNHSAVARSLSTPLKLENSMARSEATGLYSKVMNDSGDLIQKGFRGRGKEALELVKGDGTGKFWELLKTNGIENIDSNDDKAILEAISKGFRELADKSPKDPKTKECIDDVINILGKTDKKAVIDKWGPIPVGKIPILKKLLKLEEPLSEASNKIKVATGAVGATTLGRAIPSGFAKIYEGFTSNFVGGKLAPILQAYFIANAAIKAKDAPEGQKLATFMDEEGMAAATLITLPIATNAMTKLGGMKYIGMGKNVAEQQENVGKYRDMIKALNEKVDAKIISRGEYVDEVNKIKQVLKGDTKWYQKPFKFIGKILGSNYNAETVKPFIDDKIPADTGKLKALGLNVSNKIQNVLYKFKSGKFAGITPGGILRFAIVMFVLSPIVSKPIKWVINKIFGKPWDPDKEKEEQEKKAQEEAMKNNPFTKMTDEELTNLLLKNQDTMTEIQNNPELMKELQTNPQKLYDLLQEGAQKKDEALKNAPLSPLLQTYVNSRNNTQAPLNNAQNQTIAPSNEIYTQSANNNINGGLNMNQDLNLNTNAKMPAPSVQNQTLDGKDVENKKQIEPERTYIPSSKPGDFVSAQKAKDERFEALVADMDKTEKEFSKYLSI